MTETQNTKPDILSLAHYAQTRLTPLYTEAKKRYPELQWTIQITFADRNSRYAREDHLVIYELGTPASFFYQSYHLTTMAEVDAYAAQLADAVNTVTV